MAGEPDAVLVARALVDQEAFAPLYLRYVEEIARFCYLRLRDEEAARDATQQVFVRALAALGRYRETGNFRAWLYTIARNVLTDLARGRRPTLALDSALDIVDPGPTPEELAAAAIDHRALLAALARLPDDQRTAIELRLVGLNGPQAAAAMGRSYGAVKMLQLRAMERLRADLLSPEEVDRGA
jgi:RNA polymerase sigma-70 factor (ECF subfamily)